MFCPRCGQQAAEEVSFCSRCGLPLDAAAEVVEAGGLPVWHQTNAGERGGLTPRQRGMRKGLMLTVGGILFLKAAVLLTLYKEDFFVLLVPAGIFLIVGIMRLLYGLLLEAHTPAKKSLKHTATNTAQAPAREGARAELPHARTIPASAYAKPGAPTNDMVAPHSVTESTTRLLDEDKPAR